MKVNKIGILKEQQIEESSIIETLKNIGLGCYCSDLGRISGVDFEPATGNGDYWYDGSPNNDKRKVRTIKHITKNNSMSFAYSDREKIGVRIAISFDDIEDFDIDKMDDLAFEYPLYAISGMGGNTINKLFETKSKLLIKTGRVHNINDVEYEEYEVFGIKFIKYKNKVDNCILSDGTVAEVEKDIYLKVDKIPFIVDKESRIIYSSVILMSALFDSKERNYEHSDLKKYLNNGFIKSINDELKHNNPSVVFKDEIVENNRYKFNFNSLSEEEIIEICINCNIAVFLHGKTGTGKTERMITLDRNLELVDFGCTSSDGFTGIIAKDFNSKELFIYEPYWYKNLCKKCEAEPELLHILFLEELTNAKNDIQKVAFEVTLNKTLTNSGFRLKLPENAVVCAAGNEANESRSANAMSEPLFGRFAHVYIDTDSDEWLKWAMRRKKQGKVLKYKKYEEKETIHPAIIDYIKVKGNNVLRTQYNGTTPNADPRKWAMASKALYQSNNPNVLRAFVGAELAEDFIKFCKINLITVDDVLNDKVSPNEVPVDSSIRWFTILCLSNVDDENVDKVREFVGNLGKEYLATFDYEWSKDNDERIIRLYNAQPTYVKRLTLNGNK